MGLTDTVARTHLPLGPRWGFTVLPHPGQPHATVMPGVEQSVRSVMPGVEPRGRRPRERPVDVPGWAPGARRGPCRLQGAVPFASAARFEDDPQTKHHCRPSIPLEPMPCSAGPPYRSFVVSSTLRAVIAVSIRIRLRKPFLSV